ncbi:hypothetical protein B296_00058505 [Ensete ventricosum]|uniref:Uncharacterized protein n=1 Tax=Ensete ventricosum TaxID=4639 RepID=A0A426X955_ENSVE|nr:hypothetical protein B296_00058505 [Ensete ventricosum]
MLQAKPTIVATKSKEKPKALVPMKPKAKPKSKLMVVRPKGAATRPPKVPTRSAKAAKTFTKVERWRRVSMAALQQRIEGCGSSSRGDAGS